jgi:tRNA threonylcarbamoyladenosine biosynthesis protein TsaB
MFDARRNEVYAAFYKWEADKCVKIMPEIAISPEELMKLIKGPVVILGDGAKTYRELISLTLRDNALFAPSTNMSPSAATVGEIAIEHIKQGITTDPVSLTPYYIRKSEAELNWKG